MFAFSKSAVQNIPVKAFSQWLIISSRFALVTELKYSTKPKMSWEVEKAQFLESHETRNAADWTNWQDIQSWKFYAMEKDLPKPASPKPGNTIDDSYNDTLSEKISVFFGDITKLKVDAIVNAANSYLKAGGGVDGAIHRAAGPLLQKECDTLQGCNTGEAKLTGGYKLPAKYVIQTVGPRGEKPNDLKNCYQNSLQLAVDNKISSIAFPCISTGIYGFPNENAAHIAAYTVRKFLEQHAYKFNRVIFCLFMDVDKDFYARILQTYFPVKGRN